MSDVVHLHDFEVLGPPSCKSRVRRCTRSSNASTREVKSSILFGTSRHSGKYTNSERRLHDVTGINNIHFAYIYVEANILS
jgi:hypothetical protein